MYIWHCVQVTTTSGFCCADLFRGLGLHTIAMDTWTVVLENVQEHKTLFGMCDPKSEGFLFDRTLWNTPESWIHPALAINIYNHHCREWFSLTRWQQGHAASSPRALYQVAQNNMSNFIFAILSEPALQIPVRYGCGSVAMTSFLIIFSCSAMVGPISAKHNFNAFCCILNLMYNPTCRKVGLGTAFYISTSFGFMRFVYV